MGLEGNRTLPWVTFFQGEPCASITPPILIIYQARLQACNFNKLRALYVIKLRLTTSFGAGPQSVSIYAPANNI